MYEGSYVNGYVEGSRLVLFSRDGAGALKRTEVPAEWVAYFREGELPTDIEKAILRQRGLRGARREEGGWLRFSFSDPDLRRSLCFEKRNRDGFENPLLARGVPHYEADVDPVRRFFTDGTAQVARPRRCYLDIETDSRVSFSRKEDMRVLSWSVIDDEGAEQAGLLLEDGDGAERDLLGELWEVLGPYDQIAAWNGDGFDYPVIWARSEQRGLRVDARRWLYVDHLEAFRRMNMHSAESGEEKQSFRLQSIAMAILGEGKNEFDASKTYETWAAGGELRRNLVAYNVQDTALLAKIEKKTGYLELFATICEVCRLFGDTRALNPTQQMDGFLLRLAKERDHHFPSRAYRERGEVPEEQFRGAYVMEPKVLDAGWRLRHGMHDGIARNVHVADFASLYPSIILTWNMSADTKDEAAPINGPIPEGRCRAQPTGVSFLTGHKGLLPIAVEELIRMRKFWNDKKASLPPGTKEWHEADRRSMAYKVTANSFYGVVGSSYSRYFDRNIAESVTQNGVWLLQHTIAKAEERGWHVIYADTDSLFVVGCSKEEFGAFVDECNARLYPTLLRQVGCTENMIKLAYEKAFERVIFTNKKRYAGRYAHYKGKAATSDSKPEVRGLEYKRGDTALLARQLQSDVVRMLVGGEERLEEYHRVLSAMRSKIVEGELRLEEVVLGKSLGKPLKEYVVKKKADGTDSVPGPHIIVARILKDRGQDVSEGTKIEYVVVDEQNEDPRKRVIPAAEFAGQCDRHYVWETLVYPPTQRLLEAAFPAHAGHWEAWARSRPPKPRRPRGTASEKQGALFALESATETRVSVMPIPELPRRRAG